MASVVSETEAETRAKNQRALDAAALAAFDRAGDEYERHLESIWATYVRESERVGDLRSV